MTNGSGRSGWVWVAWGCGGCLLVSGAVVVVLAVAGYRMAQGVKQQLTDPAARTEKAEEILGTDELPEGYQAAIAVSLLGFFKTVILADRPMNEKKELPDDTQKLFVYLNLIRGDRRWKRYLEGQGDPTDVLRDQNVTMHSREEIGRGTLDLDGETVDYVSRRGTLTVQDHDFEGIATFLFIRCAGSKRMRVGVWSLPDPNEALPVSEADFTGTNADPQEIRSFLSQFDLCGA